MYDKRPAKNTLYRLDADSTEIAGSYKLIQCLCYMRRTETAHTG